MSFKRKHTQWWLLPVLLVITVIWVQVPESCVMAWEGQFAMEPVHFSNRQATPVIHVFQGVIIGAGIDIGLGDEVAAYDSEGRVCGVGVVGDPSLGLYFPNQFWIKVYGDDPNTTFVEGPVEGEKLSFRFWDKDRGLEYDTIPVDPVTGDEIQAIWSGSSWQPSITNINLRVVAMNQAPEILSWEASPLQVAPGESVHLSFHVKDPDNDILSYSFSAGAGGFNPQSGELSPPYPGVIETSWIAPAMEGTYQITLTITDENQATDHRRISLDVAIDDKIPPIDCGRVTARLEGQEVKLSWEPSPSADLAGYRIYQRQGDADYLEIAELSPENLGYKIGSLSLGDTYWFKVTAFDKSGNESSGREVKVEVVEDTRAPEVGVEVSGNQVWVKIRDDGLLDEENCRAEITDKDGNPVSPQPVFNRELSADGHSLTMVTVLYPGLYVIHIYAQDSVGHSTEKVFSRTVTSGQPLGFDLSESEVFIPEGNERVVKIVGGTPPYTIVGSPNPLTVRAYIEGDQLTIEAVSQGWEKLEIQDAAGTRIDLRVGVVPCLKNKNLAVTAIDEQTMDDPDPIYQPIAANWFQGQFSLSLSAPCYGQPVDIYLGVTYTPKQGGCPLLILFDENSNLVTDLVPFRSGMCDNLNLDVTSYPVSVLPVGKYVFYYLVVPEGESLEGSFSGQLLYFDMAVDEIPKGISGGVVSGIRPDPLVQPVSISRLGRDLKVSLALPCYKDGSIDLYLAVESQGEWWIVSPDGKLQPLAEGIRPFLSEVSSGINKEIILSQAPESGHFYYLIAPSGARPLDQLQDYCWGMIEF